jgi:hypothetical protein
MRSCCAFCNGRADWAEALANVFWGKIIMCLGWRLHREILIVFFKAISFVYCPLLLPHEKVVKAERVQGDAEHKI